MNDELEVFVQTRWRCPACRRSYSRRGTAVNHQAVCARDPDNRSCRTCVHNPYPDYDYSDQCEAGEMPFDPFTDARFSCKPPKELKSKLRTKANA